MIKISTNLGSIYSSLDLRLDKFESTVTKAIQGFYKLQTGTEKASSIMDKSVYTAVSNIEKSYKLWDRANERTGKSIFDNSKEIDKFKQQINSLDTEIKKSDKTLEDIEKQFGVNSKEAEEYREHVLDLKLSHSDLTEELKKAEKQTSTFAGRLELLEKEFDKIDKKYEVFDKVGDKFQSVGNKLTMGVTLPVVGAATAATKFAFDFETGAAKVATIADTTKVPIDKLKRGVIDLSNATGMSTNELNEALYQAISGSVDTAKAVDFLDVAVKAAKGGFTDTATAVDGLTTVLNSYGLAADEANNIANQMLITQNLGKTTFGELASAVGKVTPIAASLGITTEELFSSLASTTAQGLATSESITALKAAMSNIIKPSKEAGEAAEMLGVDFSVSALQSKGWIGFLSDLKKGLASASPEFDRISDKMQNNAIKLGELQIAGKENTKEYKELSKANKILMKDLEILAQAADSPIGAFATMFGSVEGLNSILMLTSENGIAKYNESMEQMRTNTGALDDAYKKMTETTQEKFNKSLTKLKNTAMETGLKLLPLVEKGINLISDLTDKFNKLSPATQENIIKIALASATMGPFLNVTGGAIKGVGSLLKLGPKVSTFFGLFQGATTAAGAVGGVGTAATVATGTAAGGGILGLGASIGSLAVAAAPWLLAGAAVAGTGYLIYKGLNEETIPTVDLFADKIEYSAEAMNGMAMTADGAMEQTVTSISEGTKKSVQAYVDMDNGVRETLNNMFVQSTIITEENSKTLTGQFNTMGNSIRNSLKQRMDETLGDMQGFFSQSVVLTDLEEASILQSTTDYYNTKQGLVGEYEKQIKDILSKASSENRALKADEAKIIIDIQNRMREEAVKTMSQNEIEAKTILQRMKDFDGRITAEQTSEHIKKLNEGRDKAIKIANEEYDKRIATIIKMRDEAGIISAEQANKLIEDAKRQRDGIVQNAENTRLEAIDKMRSMNSELDSQVNTSTGKILTAWDKIKRWWSGWKPESKNFVYQVQENKSSSRGNKAVGYNASGTNYFEGGLTTLHEKGYEVYQLPESTKIYNHQASEAMVKETARVVAQSVLKDISVPGNGDIIIPISIAGEEIDRVVVPRVSNKLALSAKGRR